MSYSIQDCKNAILRANSKTNSYLGADDYRELATEEDPSVATIANKLGSWTKAKDSLNLESLDNTCSRSPGNAVSINESYFDNPDNEAAYWIGFIYADGHITENSFEGRHRFQIGISEKDRKHIELFKSHISSSHSIWESNGRVGLATTNSNFCNSLLQHNLRGDKMNNSSIPNFNDKKFGHWLRGLHDGDGHFRRHAGSIQFQFTGSGDRFKKILETLPCGGTIKERKGADRLNFYGKNARKVKKIMYPNDINTKPMLKRKAPQEF